MLRMTLLSICSLLLSSCASLPGLPERPDTTAYQVIVTQTEGGEMYGYNVQSDYDDRGNLKPGAKPKIKPVEGLKDIRGWYCTDKEGFKNAKAYRAALTDWIWEHCK